MNELVERTKEHFDNNYPHIHLRQLDDREIASILSASHMQFNSDGSPVPFDKKMYLLYDYIVSQSLVDVDE